MDYILAINPGSTSTKVAIFNREESVNQKNISHSAEELKKYERVADQLQMRKDMILEWLEEEKFDLKDFVAIVGRGGLLRPMPGGTYKVTEAMKKDLIEGFGGDHASNLGGLLAESIGNEIGVESYIVDPVAVDEFDELARISGLPEVPRKSQGHALNIKAVGRRVAAKLGKSLDEVNMVVAHLGGGISICPLRKGKATDYNNANQMGPFSPERTGGLPCGDLVNMCFSGEYDLKQMKSKLIGKGGLVAYLGTNDAREVQKMIDANDQKAKLIYDAMAYQIAKEIGSMATVLKGEIDAVVLTGGIAYSNYLTDLIREHVAFLGKFIIEPGEDEMKALNEGALRVFNKEEEAKIYEEEVKIN